MEREGAQAVRSVVSAVGRTSPCRVRSASDGLDLKKGPSAQGFSGPDSARRGSLMSVSLTLLCG